MPEHFISEENLYCPATESRDDDKLHDVIQTLKDICLDMVRLEAEFNPLLDDVNTAHQSSARNLLHYLALRKRDIRKLQERLAQLGLSSLGRAESRVLISIESVLNILERLAGNSKETPDSYERFLRFTEGRALLEKHTENLLGEKPAGRSVRIMVTMPTEAADDYFLVRQLLSHGMNCMREQLRL